MKASVLECLDIEASYRGSGEEGADSENDGFHSNNVGERGDFEGSSDKEDETEFRVSLEIIVWWLLSICSRIDIQTVTAATNPAANDGLWRVRVHDSVEEESLFFLQDRLKV
ncbi:hypothetical protein AX14_001906 [Amanita brunnescens Koide BX004]|nr:hypothetical protein AX14_001906 [Amanita brunnescens Koide BX004]